MRDEAVDGARAFELEAGVADGERFVDDEDVGLHVGGDGEGEAHDHAAAVRFDRLIEEVTDLGEGGDGLDLGVDLGAGEAEDGGVEVDVFASRELGVEAGAEFEQGGDASLDRHYAGGRTECGGDELEQRAFARAVAADEADAFAAFDFH